MARTSSETVSWENPCPRTGGVLSREAKIAEGGGGVKVGWRWLVARDLVKDTGKEEPIQESGCRSGHPAS